MTFRVTIRDMFPHHLPFRKTIRCLDVLDVCGCLGFKSVVTIGWICSPVFNKRLYFANGAFSVTSG